MNYIEQFMKDNDIEVNEEFYVVNLNGYRIEKFKDDRFHFGVGLLLFKKGTGLPQDDVLCELLLGRCKIEKIPQKPKSVWDLKEGDEYWYITLLGYVEEVSYQSDDEDINIIKAGNAFLTREEAEHEVERRKCEAILLKYGTRDIRSLDDDTNKYYIIFDNSADKIIFPCCEYMQSQGTIYFESKELALKAIEEVGKERLKKYVFNVKE